MSTVSPATSTRPHVAGGEELPHAERILRAIRNQIVRGEMRPGDRLPTRSDISKQYSVSTFTAQAAFSSLERDGFVVSKGRSGTFVAPTLPHQSRVALVWPRVLHPITGTLDSRFYDALHLAASRDFVMQADRSAPTASAAVAFDELGPMSDKESDDRFEQLLEAARSHRYAGMFCPAIKPWMDQLVGVPGCPFVTLSCVRQDTSLAQPHARLHLDYLRFFRAAAGCVRDRGAKRVAVISSGSLDNIGFHALETALESEGVRSCAKWVHMTEPRHAAWVGNLVELLFDSASSDTPDALIVDDDHLVGLAADAVKRVRPGRVPAVVALNNFPLEPPALPVAVDWVGPDGATILNLAIDIIGQVRRGNPLPIEPVSIPFEVRQHDG